MYAILDKDDDNYTDYHFEALEKYLIQQFDNGVYYYRIQTLGSPIHLFFSDDTATDGEIRQYAVENDMGDEYSDVMLSTPEDYDFTERDYRCREFAILIINGTLYTGESHAQALGLGQRCRDFVLESVTANDDVIIGAYHKANIVYTEPSGKGVYIYLDQPTDYITVDTSDIISDYISENIYYHYPETKLYIREV